MAEKNQHSDADVQDLFKNPLEDLKHILPNHSLNQKIERSVDEIGTDITRFVEDNVYISRRIKKLASFFNNMRDLNKGKAEIYSFRQEMIDIKDRLKNLSLLKNSVVIGLRENTMIDIKKNGKNQVKPNNVDEMTLMINNSLKNDEYDLKLIDHQINHVIDSIKTIDHMIYGLDAALELEKRYGVG